MNLTVKNDSVAPLAEVLGAINPHDLNNLLIELSRWGSPRVGLYQQGWHCGINVNVNTTGTKFEVSSDFGCLSPVAAALQARDRLRVALNTLGVKP